MEDKIGIGIGVMLLRDEKVLLGKRHEDPGKASSELKGEGTWTMPGGKLRFGETFEQGAVREVGEETGIKLNAVRVICVNNDQVEGAHFVTLGLLSEDFEGEPKVKEPDEITEWKWFSLDELPSPIYFSSAKVLENYKNKVFYKEITSKREFISTVYVVRDKKVLLTFNKNVNKFIPLGGHIEENELPCSSVIREAKEESGFDIELIGPREIRGRDLIQPLAIGLDRVKLDHHHINLSYVGKIIGGGQLERSDEGTELRWFSPEELKNCGEIFENIREEGLKAIEIMESIERWQK